MILIPLQTEERNVNKINLGFDYRFTARLPHEKVRSDDASAAALALVTSLQINP